MDYDVNDSFDRDVLQQMLEDTPLGIVECPEEIKDMDYMNIEWYYNLDSMELKDLDEDDEEEDED